MEERTKAASPAAGPLTLSLDPLKKPMTIPPMIPEIMPLKKGAPDARAIPKHRGSATKKTTIPAGRSCLIVLNMKTRFCGLSPEMRFCKYQYVVYEEGLFKIKRGRNRINDWAEESICFPGNQLSGFLQMGGNRFL